jgi:hypothetical protein
MAYQNIIAAKLIQAVLNTTTANLYISPPNTQTYLKEFDICNTTGSALTAYVYLVPQNLTPSAVNALMYNVNIPAYTIVQWTGSQILNPGDSIQGASSASSGLTITISGGQAT